MGLSAIAFLGLLWTPGQVAPDVTMSKPTINIPIEYNPQERAKIREMMLYVSADQGQTWLQHATANPEKDSQFVFNAPADGMYWFNMVVVDRNGRRDPPDVYKAAAGALKVLFDTKKPIITLTNAQRDGGDVVVSWKIIENNPDWSKFSLEYSTNGRDWNAVAIRPEKDGAHKFAVGTTAALTVRMTLADTAKQTGEASKEIPGVAVVAKPMETTDTNIVRTMGMGGTGPTDIMPPPINNDRRDPRLPTEPRGTDTPVKTENGSFPPAPGTTGAPIVPPTLIDPPVAPSTTATTTPKTEVPVTPVVPLNLPPAQVINVTSFKMGYEVEDKGASGVGKAELWVTRDDGKSWRQWSVHEKPEAALLVELAKAGNPTVEGVYGFKVVLYSGAGLGREAPKPGDAPDLRVDVDTTPPIVKIYEPVPDNTQKDTMVLRWQAVDRNLANDPITLEWADNARGPWIPIATADTIGSSGVAKRLANTGSYAWKLPANFPTHRVYLKVTARDVAGNVSEATTSQPILVDLNKPTATKITIVGGSGK